MIHKRKGMAMKRALWIALAVAVAIITLGTPAQAAPPPGYPPHGAVYSLQNVASGLCLDVANGWTHDGAPIQQWHCYGGPPVKWRFEHVGYWYQWPAYQVVNTSSQRCLDVPGGNLSTPPGTLLQQWGCWGGDMQRWVMVRNPDNTYKLLPQSSEPSGPNGPIGLCMDNKDWSPHPGTRVQVWSCWNAAVQNWRLI
ncbi:RICIN domain-containing protein [Nonomuraea endophytica]|uniref:RICIN domain-containing protein n=1 Tax=Nonomuraea endophytica TaxID=714136 RepID=UPI0037CB04BE